MFVKKKIIVTVFSCLIIANLFAWIRVFDLSDKKNLEVDFFDVGQGDAAFITTPEGHQILIDGGPDFSVLEKLDNKMPYGDRTIDLIILSHPEADHMFGLMEVLKSYKVDNILWTGVLRDNPEFFVWQDLIEKENADILVGSAGQKIIIGNTEITIIHPLENLSGKILKDSNNSSLVLKLAFGKNTFLFTGDLLKKGEHDILQAGININVDVLKVGHHGSKTSTSEEFAKEVSPEFAIISLGRDNSYGHPHKITLDTLQKFGITILRIDEMGDISIVSDGNNLQIK